MPKSTVSTQTKSTLPVMKGRFPEPPRFDSTIVTCPPDKGNDVLAMFFSTEQQGDEKIKVIDENFHTPKLHSYVRTWYVFYVANDSIKQISVFCSIIHFPTTTHCPTAYCSADYSYNVYRSTEYRFIILPSDAVPSTDHPITVLPSTVLPTDVLPSTDHPITVLPSTVLPTDVLPLTDHPITVLPSTVLPKEVLPSTDHPITIPPSTVLPKDVLPSTDHPITTVLPSTVLPTDVLPSTNHPITILTSTVLPTDVLPSTDLPITVLLSTGSTAD
jgi:hypothetical protein